MLIGTAGRSLEEVYSTSMVEYEAIVQALTDAQRERWEIARWLSFNQVSISPFIKQKPTSARAFCRFPWETVDVHENEGLTPEQEAELFRILEDHTKRHNAN